jgi:hypothetical protein
MSPGAQNIKTVPNTLNTADNESKTCKRDTATSVPSKMCPGALNKKTVPDALGTAEKDSGSAKHENETRRYQYRRKCVRARKT